MVELNIRITGDTLLSDKLTEVIKVIQSIQLGEEKQGFKNEVKDKKQEKLKEKPKELEDNAVVGGDDEIKESDLSIEELKKKAKEHFIKLTKKDKQKAKNLLEEYGVTRFSELEDKFNNSEDWENIIENITK